MRPVPLACLLVLFGCGPGPTVQLGRRVMDFGDADARDAGGEPNQDASVDDDDDDDDEIACEDASVCNPDLPFCHETRLICVECLADAHCKQDEHCDRGECEEGR